MNQIIKIMVAAVASVCVLTVGAESYRSIKVVKTDGSSVVIDGGQGLAAKFAGDNMILEIGDNVLAFIPVSELKSWQLSEESGVGQVKDVADFAVSCAGGSTLLVSGIADNSTLRLHDLSGIVMAEAKASGSHTFDISNLSGGVYILSCGGKSIKIHIAK